jgi:hypothetical protein
MEDKPEIKDIDEFQKYIRQRPEKIEKNEKATFNSIIWWSDKRTKFLILYQFAFDTLTCSTMSTKCERVFSAAKKMITPKRNALSERVIEACECLKAWRRKEVISVTIDATRKRKADAIEENEE